MFSLLFFFHRKSESYSTSSGSKSHSRSRSRSDSPPRQFNHSSSYKGSKVRSYKKSKDYKYSTHKPRKSRSRSSSRSRSRSRERSDHSGKYKKKSHYYRNHRHERSRSYERASHRYDRDHPGHSRHRRWIKQKKFFPLEFKQWSSSPFGLCSIGLTWLVNHLAWVMSILLAILYLLSWIQRKDTNMTGWCEKLILINVLVTVLLVCHLITLQNLSLDAPMPAL